MLADLVGLEKGWQDLMPLVLEDQAVLNHSGNAFSNALFSSDWIMV